MIVNELSNTIDLPSTLIRAEALFIRFRKTVEAIDKKSNFPSLSIRPRIRPSTSTSSETDPAPSQPPIARLSDPRRPAATRASGRGDPATASSSSTDARTGKQSAAQINEQEEQKAKERVISPELRDLLSRKVTELDSNEIKHHGGGIN